MPKSSKDGELEVARYAEIIGDTKTAKDVITGQNVDLTQNIKLTPRQSLIIEF